MSCKRCMIITTADGENVCARCGIAFNYGEIACSEEFNSHSIMYTKRIGNVDKIASRLSLPSFVLQTIVKVSADLIKENVMKRHALLFATIYACRVHQVPRLLEQVLHTFNNVYGCELSRYTALKILNAVSKKAWNIGYNLNAPNKYYYLKAYLAKIQDLIVDHAGMEYYEYLRSRAFKSIEYLGDEDPSNAAKRAISTNVSRTLQLKLEKRLGRF